MFPLPPLPYPQNALEPVMSAETVRFHHDKHQAGYVETTNALMTRARVPVDTFEAVVAWAASAENIPLFNSAAQAWNHAFFWSAMSPDHDQPTGVFQDAINLAFGDLAGLKVAFIAAGVGQFASGWVWLAADLEGRLHVYATHDAGTVLTRPELTPLLVCDVWEHAYYLDHLNDRKAYLEAWFDTLPNWGLAGAQWAASRSEGFPWRYPASNRAIAAE
jgi:Fe-Mn family superoxide dismutase